MIGFILGLLILSTGGWAAERAVVSVVFSSEKDPYQKAFNGFKSVFKEGNIALLTSEYNLEKSDPDAVCPQIKKEKPELILSLGTNASRLVGSDVKDIPMVFSMVLGPEDFHNSNSTGVLLKISPAMIVSGVKKILPGAKKIGVIYSEASISTYEELEKNCTQNGLQMVGRKIGSSKEFPDSLKDIGWRIDLFVMIPDPDIYFPKSVEYLLMESIRSKFPVLGLSSAYTKAGAWASFECDYEDLGRQSGEMAIRIIRGEKPETIPIESARKVSISLNVAVAKKMGIKISREILKEAASLFGQ